jgi:hypothetical protein
MTNEIDVRIKRSARTNAKGRSRRAGNARKSEYTVSRTASSKPRRGKNANFFPKSSQSASIPRDQKSSNAAVVSNQASMKQIENFVTQTILPSETGSIVRSPSLANFKNHCTKFNTSINLDFDATGTAVGRFVPNAYFIEVGNTTAQAIDAFNITVEQGDTGFSRGTMTTYVGSVYIGEVQSTLIPSSAAPVFPLNMPTGSFYNFDDYTYFESNAVEAIFYNASFQETRYPLSTGTIIQLTEDMIGIWIGAPGKQPLCAIGGSTVKIEPGTAFTTNPIQQLPASMTQVRTTALTGLVSYQGSTLENAGTIVMCLTDPRWCPELGKSVFDSLNALGDRKYVGPLKKGCYGWWTPLNQKEKNPQSPPDWLDSQLPSCLWFAVKGATEGQTIKLEGNQLIEFADPGQVFAKVPCPPESAIYQHLFFVFNHLPHVMENPDHVEKGKSLIGKVMGSVKDAAKNPVALGMGMLALV